MLKWKIVGLQTLLLYHKCRRALQLERKEKGKRIQLLGFKAVAVVGCTNNGPSPHVRTACGSVPELTAVHAEKKKIIKLYFCFEAMESPGGSTEVKLVIC